MDYLMYAPPPHYIDWDAYFKRARIEAMVENLLKCISNPSHKNLKRCVNDACRRSDAQALTFLDSQLESLKANGRVDAGFVPVMKFLAQKLEATLN